MLVMVADMYNENAKSNFSDVKSGAWYESYIASAYKNGLVSGVTENTFGVGKFITRQDMAVICYRVLEKKGIPSNERDFNGFQDEDTISDYAKEAVKELYILGMINGTGDGCFSPLLLATRAQSAVMIYNLLIK